MDGRRYKVVQYKRGTAYQEKLTISQMCSILRLRKWWFLATKAIDSKTANQVSSNVFRRYHALWSFLFPAPAIKSNWGPAFFKILKSAILMTLVVNKILPTSDISMYDVDLMQVIWSRICRTNCLTRHSPKAPYLLNITVAEPPGCRTSRLPSLQERLLGRKTLRCAPSLLDLRECTIVSCWRTRKREIFRGSVSDIVCLRIAWILLLVSLHGRCTCFTAMSSPGEAFIPNTTEPKDTVLSECLWSATTRLCCHV